MRCHHLKMAVPALLVALAIPAIAHADTVRCTEADKTKWLPATTVKRILQDQGFTGIGTIKTNDGNCYVVRASDQSGTKMMLYLNPTDGTLIDMQ